MLRALRTAVRGTGLHFSQTFGDEVAHALLRAASTLVFGREVWCFGAKRSLTRQSRSQRGDCVLNAEARRSGEEQRRKSRPESAEEAEIPPPDCWRGSPMSSSSYFRSAARRPMGMGRNAHSRKYSCQSD